MRSQLPFLALTVCSMACGASSTGGDEPVSTEAARDSILDENPSCLLPVRMPVTQRSPLWMIGTTTIERHDVFWWHGSPQPEKVDPTTTFAIDRHDEDADASHYEGHEIGARAAGRLLVIDVSRRPPMDFRPIGTATVSTPGRPDEVIELRGNAPCAEL